MGLNGLSKKELWSKVRPSWEKAHKFILTMSSSILGRVDPEIRSLRILSCHGVDKTGKQVDSPCQSRIFSKEKQFHSCNQCGCGDTEIARISSYGSTEDRPLFKKEEYIKLDFPYLQCPMQKKGFSNYEGDENIQGTF